MNYFNKIFNIALSKIGLIRKADADAAQADRDRAVKDYIRKLAAAAKEKGVNVIFDQYHMVTDKQFNSSLFVAQDNVHISNCNFIDGGVLLSPLNKGISLSGCYFSSTAPDRVAQRLMLKGKGFTLGSNDSFQTLNSSSNSVFLAESGSTNFSCASSHDSGSSNSSSSDGGSSSGGCD